MNKTIFNKIGITEDWASHLYDLTPVELHSENGKSLFFKREDFFAPLGYGGINGSKLRQGIFLGEEYASNPEVEYIVGGMSYHSPQLIMQSAIGKRLGKKVICVTSGTSKNLLKHEMVRGAQWFGAKLVCDLNPGYNGVLQKKCREIQSKLGEKKAFYLEYGITLGLHHHPTEIYKFHRVGAYQVQNIPDEIENLIIPFGSANSATSILLGLALYPKKNLKRIYLIGVGPDKRDYLTRRLEMMDLVTPPDLLVFSNLPYNRPPKEKPLYEVIYVPFKYAYSDLIYNSFDDIDFHPTYEGKVYQVIKDDFSYLLNEKTLFWIVGSQPSIEAMTPYFSGNQLDTLEKFEL